MTSTTDPTYTVVNDPKHPGMWAIEHRQTLTTSPHIMVKRWRPLHDPNRSPVYGDMLGPVDGAATLNGVTSWKAERGMQSFTFTTRERCSIDDILEAPTPPNTARLRRFLFVWVSGKWERVGNTSGLTRHHWHTTRHGSISPPTDPEDRDRLDPFRFRDCRNP